MSTLALDMLRPGLQDIEICHPRRGRKIPLRGLGPIHITPQMEVMLPYVDRQTRRSLEIVMMAGSLSNYASKKIADLLFGATAYTAESPYYVGLWASALDDTFTGGTTGECAYGSYGRMSLTNNGTIFATGSGTGIYTKTFPSDALKSWAASTATGTNNTVTYLGWLNANAGTSADKGIAWCTISSTTINSGDTPQLAQNAVTYTQD